MAIHTAADLVKALQTPRPESPFQVGEAQLKAIREISQILMQLQEHRTVMLL